MNTMTIYQLIKAKQLSSPNRLWRDAGWALAILTVLMIFGQVIEPTSSHDEYVSFAFAMFVIAVIEMGSHTFNEFKHPRSSVQWFTLPATTLEKWTSNFITSLLIVPVAFLFVLTVATLLANLFIGLFGWGIGMPIFNPFSAEGLTLLKFFWCIHPIMFFGAIYFKKRPMLKIFGSLSILLLALALFTGFVGDLLFNDVFNNNNFHNEGMDENNFSFHFGENIHISQDGIELVNGGLLKFFAYAASIAYFIFFWSLSYLRLKEMEL
jgi:hypothetical protein